MRVHLQGWCLRLSDDWTKYKEILPELSDPDKNVETKFNSKLKFK